MPNWKKVITSGSDAALNSLNVTSALTASGLNYPSSDGTDGQVLMTDGSGVLTFSDNITYVTVKNVSGGTLSKGTPVHATGTTGNTPEVIASSASLASSMPANFVLAENITTGTEGRAILSGFLNGVNTTGLTEGDNIYVAPTGNYTTTKPQGDSNLIQNIAIVGSVGVNGSIYVYGSGRSNDIPNLPVGKIWVGSNNYSVTSSFVHLDEANLAVQITGSLSITNLTSSNDVLIGDIDAIEDRYITLPGRSGGNAGILFNDRGTVRASLIYDGNQDFVLSTDVPDAQSGPRDFIFKSNGKEMFTINGNLGNIFVSGSADILNKLFIRNVAADTTLSNKALVLKTFDGEVQSRDLGDSAFQDTGSMTVLNADSANTATTANNVNIGTVTTPGEYDILYTGNGSKISQDTSGDFVYNPDSNLLTVSNILATELTSSRLQVAGIDYPTSDGTSGQVLTTNGSGQLSFSTAGTDTNIANTDLTATANRTLDMGNNYLTISASKYLIDTFGGNFEVDARQGTFKVKSDTGHYVYIEGLPNTETPNIVGYDPTLGRLSYYSTGSFSGGGGSTVYTPDIYEIQTENTITANDTALAIISTGAGGPTILDGTTGTERNPLDTHVVDFNSTGVFEITYTVNLSHGDPATDNRMNPAIYAKAGDAGVGGTLSEVHGSLNATYIRLPGANNAPNGSIHGKFYYNNTTAAHSLVLYLTFLGTTSNPDIDVVNHVSGLKNTLTIRKIS